MVARPTTSMKKGWLCRTSYHEKNHEIAPVMMIQIEWWSRSSDDPYLVMMFQWWSRSSDDISMTIQIEWWSKSNDEYDLKMNITWRWRWLEDEDDENSMMTQMIQRRRLVLINCSREYLLVKRECWCICNFGMYSPIYLMYCTPMFIPGSVCNVFESFYASMFLLGASLM